MNLSHLATLCADISHFGDEQNWRFKAMPVISYEFATIKEFCEAVFALEQMLRTDPSTQASGISLRIVGSHTREIDCCGVTFRLICHEQVMTVRGPYGAAELKPDHFASWPPPSYIPDPP